MPVSTTLRESTVVASRCEKIAAGAGSVMSSAGTYTAWMEVMDPLRVLAMRSSKSPISVASVG